jgi:hypothetical protein
MTGTEPGLQAAWNLDCQKLADQVSGVTLALGSAAFSQR